MSKTNTKKATSPNEEKKNRTDRFIDGAKDFINFANLGLVVQIYWSIEKGYLLICELCHCITLTCMNKRRNLCAHKKIKTITLFTPKASLFQQNTNHNHETKQTYDFGRWALVTKATASTMTTKMATSKTAAETSVSTTSKTTTTQLLSGSQAQTPTPIPPPLKPKLDFLNPKPPPNYVAGEWVGWLAIVGRKNGGDEEGRERHGT